MKNRIAFVAALLLGILAILAIRSYVKRVELEASAKLKGTPVVIARTELAPGAEIAEEMLGLREVPAQFIPPQAVRQGDRPQIIGRSVRVPINAGQIVLWSDLATERRGGLSTLIPEKEGAFSLSISRGIQPSLIQPNDHIDILASFAAPAQRDAAAPVATWREVSDMVTVVLLQNVTVLAVGQQYGGQFQNEASGGGSLTLSVTLPEAQLLMFATQHGELGAVLRREGDGTVMPRADLPRVTFEAIETIIGDLDQRRDQRTSE